MVRVSLKNTFLSFDENDEEEEGNDVVVAATRKYSSPKQAASPRSRSVECPSPNRGVTDERFTTEGTGQELLQIEKLNKILGTESLQPSPMRSPLRSPLVCGSPLQTSVRSASPEALPRSPGAAGEMPPFPGAGSSSRWLSGQPSAQGSGAASAAELKRRLEDLGGYHHQDGQDAAASYCQEVWSSASVSSLASDSADVHMDMEYGAAVEFDLTIEEGPPMQPPPPAFGFKASAAPEPQLGQPQPPPPPQPRLQMPHAGPEAAQAANQASTGRTTSPAQEGARGANGTRQAQRQQHSQQLHGQRQAPKSPQSRRGGGNPAAEAASRPQQQQQQQQHQQQQQQQQQQQPQPVSSGSGEGAVGATVGNSSGVHLSGSGGNAHGSGGVATAASWHRRPWPKEYRHGHVPKNMNLEEEYKQGREAAPTTLMIRNIPNHYTQRQLINELDDLGFKGTFDFLYIPLDKGTMSNVGYAFVNFVEPDWAERCMAAFQNYRFKRHRKIAAVSVAHIQGLEANLAHYENAAVNTAKLKQRRPVIMANISQTLSSALDSSSPAHSE